MKSILFVCMANTCRSPALAATLKKLAAKKGVADQLQVDSAGIGWSQVGQRPDPRTIAAASKRGIVIDHVSQQFRDDFFDEFDLILAVDPMISEQLKLRSKNLSQRLKIHLATDFSRKFKGQPILDPYYMSGSPFDDMMEVVVDCCEGLIESFQSPR